MKRLRVRTLCALFLLSVSSAAFGATTIFGPRTYTRASGAPQTFTETIAVEDTQSCGGHAAYIAVIENGAQSNAVDSGEITLDGTVILGESGFRQGRATREIPVSLGASSTLSVTLKGGKPGSAITVSIRKELHEDLAPAQTYTLTEKQSTFTQSIQLGSALERAAVDIRLGDSVPAAFSVRLNGTEIASTKSVTGSLALAYGALQANNTLEVDVKGDPGDSIAVAVRRIAVNETCGPSIAIASPAPGAVVSSARVIVTGSVVAQSRDVGVTVNGRVAELDLWHLGTAADPFRFVAAFDADSGPLDLEAVVRDGSGAEGTATRSVTVAPAPEPFALRVAVDHGVAPFTATFSIFTSTPERLQSYDIDYNGDGTYDVTNVTSFGATPTYNYATPRIYTARLRARDVSGATFTSVAYVAVQHPAAIDAVVQARWAQLREAFAAQDVEGALTLFSFASRGKYRHVFTALFDRLPALAAAMATQKPAAISITADDADYLVTRMEDGRKKGYHLTLMRDGTGVWKIADF